VVGRHEIGLSPLPPSWSSRSPPSRLGVRGLGPKVVRSFCTKSKFSVYIGIWFIFPMVYLLTSYLSSLSLFHINPP
jgi:hypothetical protein